MNPMKMTILAAILALFTTACSDDTSNPKPETCCAEDAALGDSSSSDTALHDAALQEAAASDASSSDASSSEASSSDAPLSDAPPLDMLPDLPAGKKLLKFVQCSKDTSCKPYCGAIGSKSEGWHDGCTKKLMNDPFSGTPMWDQCVNCAVICDAIGSWSEGWYRVCP